MRVERQVVFWVIALLAALALLALLKGMLLPFVVGIAIAYFLNPIADALERVGLGRGLAATLIILGGFIVGALAVVLALPIVVEQVRTAIAALPGGIERLRTAIEALARSSLGEHFPAVREAITRAAGDIAQSGSGVLATIARGLWSQGQALFSLVSLALVTPVVVYYLLVDWHPLLDRINGWLPREHAPTLRRLAGEMNGAVAAFVRGQGLVCLVLSAYYVTALTWLGIDYSILIGLGTGMFAFVPYVAWALGLIAAAIVTLMRHWPSLIELAMVAGVFAVGMALETAVLGPRLVGERLGLHPLWLLFALFVFSYLFGFVGTVVAVPLAAATAVLARYGLERYLASDFYLGDGHASGAAGTPVAAPARPPSEPHT